MVCGLEVEALPAGAAPGLAGGGEGTGGAGGGNIEATSAVAEDRAVLAGGDAEEGVGLSEVLPGVVVAAGASEVEPGRYAGFLEGVSVVDRSDSTGRDEEGDAVLCDRPERLDGGKGLPGSGGGGDAGGGAVGAGQRVAEGPGEDAVFAAHGVEGDEGEVGPGLEVGEIGAGRGEGRGVGGWMVDIELSGAPEIAVVSIGAVGVADRTVDAGEVGADEAEGGGELLSVPIARGVTVGAEDEASAGVGGGGEALCELRGDGAAVDAEDGEVGSLGCPQQPVGLALGEDDVGGGASGQCLASEAVCVEVARSLDAGGASGLGPGGVVEVSGDEVGAATVEVPGGHDEGGVGGAPAQPPAHGGGQPGGTLGEDARREESDLFVLSEVVEGCGLETAIAGKADDRAGEGGGRGDRGGAEPPEFPELGG